MPPRLSVVNYDAWSQGYMPPCEHVLIDELSRKDGARVVVSTRATDFAYWLVVRGDVDRKSLAAIAKQVHLMMDALSDKPPQHDAHVIAWRVRKFEP